MSLYERLKNTAFSLSGNVLGLPLQLLGFVLAARYLGPEQYGVYVFAWEYSFLCASVGEGGLGIVANRELARHPGQTGEILAALVSLKFLLGGVVYLLATGAAWFWTGSTAEFLTVAVAGISALILISFPLVYGVLRAVNRMGVEGVVAFLQPCTYVVFVYGQMLIAAAGLGALGIAACLCASYLVALGFGLVRMRDMTPATWRADGALMRTLMRQALPIGVAYVLSTAYLRTVFIFLKQWTPPQDVACINVAINLVFNINIVPSVLCGAWISTLALNYQHSRQEFLRQSLILFGLLLAGCLATIAVCYPLGQFIINLLFSKEYAAAGPLFQQFIFMVIPMWMAAGMQSVLACSGRQGLWTWLMAIGLAANLLGCVLLIPRFGVQGGVWAMLFAGTASLVVGLWFCFGKIARPGEWIQACRRSADEK